eukprot:11095226-Lingulodinium_polyedra.AAC.1
MGAGPGRVHQVRLGVEGACGALLPRRGRPEHRRAGPEGAPHAQEGCPQPGDVVPDGGPRDARSCEREADAGWPAGDSDDHRRELRSVKTCVPSSGAVFTNKRCCTVERGF